jgi:hypothetical protein
MLALLAEDLADLPPDLLDAAIRRHVAASPFMPRAAELIALAREIERAGRAAPPVRAGPSYAHDLAAHYNARRLREDIEWVVDAAGEVAIRASDRR